jgi:hypothetical protein
MRLLRPICAVALSFVTILLPLKAQRNLVTNQSVGLMQQSLATLAPSGVPQDVIISGSVHRIAGSDDETGTGVVKLVTNGSVRFDWSFPSGTAREVHAWSGSGISGSWTGPDGNVHAIPVHNLLSEPSWFFPAFMISGSFSASVVIVDVGPEARADRQVEHYSVSQTPPIPDVPGAVPFQHLTQFELYIDVQTLVPASVRYNIHPDANAGQDIPVEVDFSDYRSISGGQVPFHFQKYINNTLVLDFQVQSISLNSGISASEFILQ